MASNAQDPIRDHHHRLWVARRRREWLRIIAGLVCMGCGYGLLAVSPDTPSEWLLPRVVLGFVALLGGAAAALSPLLERLLQQ